MTSGEGAPFLTVDEFVGMWRPLSTAKRAYAEQLLAAAARRIRDRLPNIAANDPDAKLVSFQVVKSAMLPDGDAEGFSTFNRTVGERTEGGTLLNPGALLLFTDYHWGQLGISPTPDPSYNFPRDDY